MSVNPKIKILVVDDSGTMRVMFKQMLNKAGDTPEGIFPTPGHTHG